MLFRRCSGTILTIATLTLVSIGCAEAAKIKVSFSYIGNRIRPDPLPEIPVTVKFDIDLAEDGQIKENMTRSGVTASDNFKMGTKLGGGQWDVVNENELRRTINQPQSTLTLNVTIKGDKCTLNVTYALKPGFTEYQFRRIDTSTWAFFTEPKIKQTTCVIE